MTLVIDAQIAGISGDMLLSSLVHMGACESKIKSGLLDADMPQGSELNGIEFERVKKHGLEATAMHVKMSGAAHDAAEIRRAIETASAKLSAEARSFTLSSIDALIKAEATVHGVPEDSVHLHEAASPDTFVDIIGSAIALDDLNLFSEQIICTPVAVGGGTLEFSHGTTSNPAGAILEILRGKNIEIRGGPADTELTTPTGASMLVSLASSCERFYPPMSPSAIGYGAGSADHDGFSNVLKLVHGTASTELGTDTVRILETNLDDVTGELLGHVIDTLMQSGARDVTVSPAVTKKGRPTSLISVICDAISYDAVLSKLVSETGTLGVRVRDSARIVVHRELETKSIEIRGQRFEVRYKIAHGAAKPEHDDVARVASALGVALRDAQNLISAALGEHTHD